VFFVSEIKKWIERRMIRRRPSMEYSEPMKELHPDSPFYV